MTTARASTPITAEALERALDRLALEIKAFGSRGLALLPIYKALEDELERINQDRETMASVLARLKRVEDQTSAPSAATRRA